MSTTRRPQRDERTRAVRVGGHARRGRRARISRRRNRSTRPSPPSCPAARGSTPTPPGVGRVGHAALLAAPRTRRFGATPRSRCSSRCFPANVNMVRLWWDKPWPMRLGAIARLPLQIPMITAANKIRRASPKRSGADRPLGQVEQRGEFVGSRRLVGHDGVAARARSGTRRGPATPGTRAAPPTPAGRRRAGPRHAGGPGRRPAPHRSSSPPPSHRRRRRRTPRRCGPARCASPSDHLEGHLDVDRRPRRPRRRHERGLQLGEFLGVGAAHVAVDRAGQVIEVEEPLGAVEPLHPVVKSRAQQRVSIGTRRQPPVQPRHGAPAGRGPARRGC